MATDLTVGKPAGLLWRFSIPMLLSSMFQQMYNIADSIIAGNFIGMSALAAIGASHPATMIFLAIAQGCNIGCSVVISQLFGEKNLKKLRTAVSTSLISILALSLGLTVFGLIFGGHLLRGLNTPTDIFADSLIYFQIYTGGLFFLFLFNICNGVSTAMGDSRTPLFFLIVSSVLNVFLDLLFINGFHMGVPGSAWATFLSQLLCSVAALFVLYRRMRDIAPILPGEKVQLFSAPILAKTARIAIPSIIQQSCVSIGNILVQGLINTFGSATIAGFTAAQKINSFILSASGTLSGAVSSFTAQNMGAKKPERVHQGFKAGVLLSFVVSAVFSILSLLFAHPLTELFLDTTSAESAGAIYAGASFLQVIAPFYMVVGFKHIVDGILRGTGSVIFFIIATFTSLVLRVIVSFTLAPVYASLSISIAWPIGWTAGAIVSVILYRIVIKRVQQNPRTVI